MTVNIEEWVEPRYRAYSIYVSTKRALPHLIDGFKPSQRKIMFTAKRRAKKFIKVISLSGYTVAEAGYHHGDASLNDAISLIGQSFTGSNNYPLLDTDGMFGNKFGAGPSAPRYIFVKLSKNYDKFFREDDFDIIEDSIDIENPEPQFYMPILPYVLINGISGIAVGYSVEIPSYNIKDIVKNVKSIISGSKKRFPVSPHYNGYSGKIIKNDDSWEMHGTFKRVNTTTIEVSELPIDMTTEKYKKILNTLIDKGEIKDYDDLSDSNWKFIIRAPRVFVSLDDSTIISKLKLKMKIKENINVIYDENIISYGNDTIKLIEDFVKVRLSYYKKRKNNNLLLMKEKMIKLFIRFATNNYIIKKKDKKLNSKEVIDYVVTHDKAIRSFFKDKLQDNNNKILDRYDKYVKEVVSSVRLSELYSDKLNEYIEKIEEISDQYNQLYATTVNDLYLDDLKELK